ncbi:MAG: hypothetical protein A2030_08500 [Chloroflexi bacterium RBG_19FT_COMBO_50_10]|nr:MAG: hypothetical protein A2030_08500 [Chloroflexi bacterium RBG_19FT_COMBO_50_10]
MFITASDQDVQKPIHMSLTGGVRWEIDIIGRSKRSRRMGLHEHFFQGMEEAVSGKHPDAVALNPFFKMTIQSELAFTLEFDNYQRCSSGGRIEQNGIIPESGLDHFSNSPARR